MDDLQFRRTLYADPKCQDPEFVEAKLLDSSREKISQEIDQLDADIAKALNVPVPDELCDKLILRQTLASHRQEKKKTRIHLALAASVAFAFGLTLNFMQFSSAYSGLGDYALAHAHHEDGYFDNNDSVRVSLASLNAKMATFDGSFSGVAGELISADYCRFDGIKSLHLVYKGEHSPINIFIVPSRDEVSFDKAFSDSQYKGIAESYGQQNLIVVAEKGEPIQKWQENVAKNIQWSI